MLGRAKRTLPSKKAERVVQRFVKQMHNIDCAMGVRRLEDEDGITVWTIVEVSPLDYKALEPVYEAELEAMRSVDEPIFDFRLITQESIEDIPTTAKAMWNREDASRN